MAKLMLCAAALLLVAAPVLADRSLLQTSTQQCAACIGPNVQCRSGEVECMANRPLPIEAGGVCSANLPTGVTGLSADCFQLPTSLLCPKHLYKVEQQVCGTGVRINSVDSCNSCATVKLAAICDIYDRTELPNTVVDTGRFTVESCANPVVSCTPGQIVDVSAFGCANNIFPAMPTKIADWRTNPKWKDENPRAFFLDNIWSFTPNGRFANKVKCPAAGSCQWRIAAMGDNECPPSQAYGNTNVNVVTVTLSSSGTGSPSQCSGEFLPYDPNA